MNREIKFRAWDKENKIMLNEFTLQEIADEENGFSQTQMKRHIYMQFTGLKDKTGKEIFEGDIVRFQMTRRVLVNHPVMVAQTDEEAIYEGVVKWSEYGWRPFVDGKIEDIEIIGNIYEQESVN